MYFMTRLLCFKSCSISFLFSSTRVSLSSLSSHSTAVSQKLLLELRNRTSMPLIQCKAALIAAQGNIDAAMAQLEATYADRYEGRKELSESTSRDADAGCIALKIAANGKMASLVLVRSAMKGQPIPTLVY